MRNTTTEIDYSDLSHGKYDNPMASYLFNSVMMNGDFGEDELNYGEGEGMARYGRRILYWDNQGFVGCDTFRTVELAQEHFQAIYDRSSEPCEDCGEPLHYDDYEDHTCEVEGTLYHKVVTISTGVAWFVDAHYPNDTIKAHMVGDDRPFNFDASDATVLDDEDYCSSCGQIGCGHG